MQAAFWLSVSSAEQNQATKAKQDYCRRLRNQIPNRVEEQRFGIIGEVVPADLAAALLTGPSRHEQQAGATGGLT